ncbi:MAG: phosphoglucomutase/phosphomannomutase family protein [Dehalococcoidia bacterium]
MASPIKFGTDGWRGVMAEDFTFANVRVCAQAVAEYVKDRGLAQRGVVVGYDTRFLSDAFAEAVAQVLAANGIGSYLCRHPTPTPVVSYGIVNRKAAGAVVITASHNPSQWNGFKYKPEYAGSASPEVVRALEGHISRILATGDPPSVPLDEGVKKGWIEYVDLKESYREHLSTLVDLERLRGARTRVVVDSMYGAGAGYLKSFLAGGSMSVQEIRRVRNPMFPGLAQPEPIDRNLAALRRAVRRGRADVGLATDGDADRVGAADEKGEILTPLQIFGLLAYYLLEVRGERGPIIKSITSTRMANRLGEIYQVPVHETPVGFKYIGPLMTEENALIGGEESGGFGFRGHIPERDGILSSLYILDLLAQTGRTLSQLLKDLYALVGPHYYRRIDLHLPQELKSPIVERISSSPPKHLNDSVVADFDTTDGLRFSLEDGSWLLIRFSGTEPLMRIYAEGHSPEQVERHLSAGRELAGV